MTDVPAPPYDDDEPEFRPRPRRRAHALTFVLAGALLVAAGFYGGVLAQKHDAGASTSASGSALPAPALRARPEPREPAAASEVLAAAWEVAAVPAWPAPSNSSTARTCT
jgi:hypothetical protein